MKLPGASKTAMKVSVPFSRCVEPPNPGAAPVPASWAELGRVAPVITSDLASDIPSLMMKPEFNWTSSGWMRH